MELRVVPKGAGKYTIFDKKDRTIYTVGKVKKLFEKFPITTLYDASGYALYVLQRTAAGKKPSFRISFNDSLYMTVSCKSIFLDPSLEFEGQGLRYQIKSKDRKNFEIIRNGELVGKMLTEKQTNNEPVFVIEVDDKVFDDYIPLFAVCADKCFTELNK